MNKTLTLCLFILSVTIVLSSSALEAEEYNNNGPVANMMENFAEHTVSVSNELLVQLLAKTEHTAKTLMDNIEGLMKSAMTQLTQPLDNFQSKIASSQCQPLITLQQLNQQIDSDLSKCTQRMKEILNTFQQDVNAFRVAFEQSIKEIMALPKKCESAENGASFGNKVSCYIGNIGAFNQQIAVILHNANETLAHARQLGEKSLQEGRTCASNVIATTADSLDKVVATCQLVEQ